MPPDSDAMTEPARVIHAPEHRRYEAWLGDQLVGYADYRDLGRSRVFDHTVVEPEVRGRGIANQMVRRALDDVRSADMTVVPECEFVQRYIAEHPGDADLVADP